MVDDDQLLSRARALAHTAAEANQAYVRAVRTLCDDNAERSLADAPQAEQTQNTWWRNTRPRQWHR